MNDTKLNPAPPAARTAGSQQQEVRQKLWRVCLRGRLERYNPSYVVAPDPDAAYKAVRANLDARDYGFDKDRELQTVELLAENYDYTDTGSILFLPNGRS